MRDPSYKTSVTKCEKCSATCSNHKWGMIRAYNEGWFFSKDRKAFCPAHVPSWVAGWRMRQK